MGFYEAGERIYEITVAAYVAEGWFISEWHDGPHIAGILFTPNGGDWIYEMRFNLLSGETVIKPLEKASD